MKTEVYSWRVSGELKSELEREARFRKVSVSYVLELAARDWLKRSALSITEDEEQRKLHAAAAKCLGTLAGGNPRRAKTVRESIREHLRQRYAR